MSILFYRRPDFVDKAPGYLNDSACQRYVERTKGSKHKPPQELSFDNIINNKTLPPTTLGDFMDYLLYVAHDAEPLQFYLWYLDYSRRFAALPAAEQALSPAWNFDSSSPSFGGRPFHSNDKDISVTSATPIAAPRSFSRLGQAPQISASHIPAASLEFEDFPQPLRADEGLTALPQDRERDAEGYVGRATQAHLQRMKTTADAANAQAGLKWSGFTIQPFRPEVTRILTHYLSPSSPRELNLAHTTRASILHALQHTTHPSAFLPAVSLIETQLRHQSHPNFIRWSICNGNAPKIFFVRTMGVSTTLLGFVIAILLTLSHVNRWARLAAAPMWLIGITTLVAAYKGLCVILHSAHSRNLRPWEDPAGTYATFGAEADDVHLGANPGSSNLDGTPSLAASSMEKARGGGGSGSDRDSFTAGSYVFGEKNEEWESEPWVGTYKRRNVVSKIFEKSVAVQEGAVRVVQDRIVRQSQVWAAICTVLLCVVFVAVPKGNFY